MTCRGCEAYDFLLQKFPKQFREVNEIQHILSTETPNYAGMLNSMFAQCFPDVTAEQVSMYVVRLKENNVEDFCPVCAVTQEVAEMFKELVVGGGNHYIEFSQDVDVSTISSVVTSLMERDVIHGLGVVNMLRFVNHLVFEVICLNQ